MNINRRKLLFGISAVPAAAVVAPILAVVPKLSARPLYIHTLSVAEIPAHTHTCCISTVNESARAFMGRVAEWKLQNGRTA